jgi:uncharacterized protein DUF1254
LSLRDRAPLLLILIYAAICIAIFKIFRIPVNKWTLPTAALGGIFMIGFILVVMNYNHPFTGNARIYFATTPIMPDVKAPGQSPIGGPMNSFANVAAYPTADLKAVVRPNFDTLYSSGWLDLTKGPLIVSVPDTGGRYYLSTRPSGFRFGSKAESQLTSASRCLADRSRGQSQHLRWANSGQLSGRDRRALG